jgi:pimeloyl-ACP methyl ester carboxylesterase
MAVLSELLQKRMSRILAAALVLGAALHSLPAGALDLSDCRISAGPGAPSIAARCGELERPLNPDDPEAGTITLKVAVVAALSLEPETDAFVPIAGGPGGSSIVFYAGWAHAFERVRQERDILLVDQRGTGESAPMTCDTDDDVVEGLFSIDETRRVMEECLEALPFDPRFFTTSVAVRDLEAVREALGYSALNLYGSSYGTRVAQHYARRYPDSTRTVIIDGVVPPQLPLGPEIATESQRAMDRVLDRCSSDPDCSDRFPAIHEDFQRLRATLAAGPVTVAASNPATGKQESLDFGEMHMAVAIRLLLYGARSIALIPLVINEAANGNYGPLAAQYQMTMQSMSDALSIGMHNSVMCTEDAPYIDYDAIDREAIEASYLGPAQIDAIEAMCSIWPQGPIDDDLHTPLATDIPVLLLSGDADPITPPRYANLAAVDLEKAWLLTGVNQGHGLGPVGCMPRIVGKFVDSALLEDGDTDCMDDNFVMPFFLDYSGPTP